jgi:hypothetical protein
MSKTTKEDWPRPYKGGRYRDNMEAIFGRHGIPHGIAPADLDDLRIGQRDRAAGTRYLGCGCSQRCTCEESDAEA